MTLPATFTLARAKTNGPLPRLDAQLLDVPNTQPRLTGRKYLKPDINLDAYRFQAVIDWIDVELTFNKATQLQHVQAILRKFLCRDSYITPHDPGPGNTFTTCTVRIQEPKDGATIARIERALIASPAEATEAHVSAIEVSLDVYPRSPSDAACEALLAALQRTIWLDRDIWSNPDSRPRVAFGKGRNQRFKLSPGPENDRLEYSRITPLYHQAPPLDATMYLGARSDDVMVRVMHKILDKQRPDGTHLLLAEHERRVRTEVCIKGSALAALGIDSVESLKTFRFSSLQRLFFHFKLPTYSYSDQIKKPADLMRRMREAWRAETFLKAGVIATSTMDRGIEKFRQKLMPGLRKHLRMHPPSKKASRLPRRKISYLTWSEMNQKANIALQSLDKRQATSWRKTPKE